MIKYFLYKKTHNKTGLRYLGYTTKNPHEYPGSGKYWKRHIKTHGYDVETEILCETFDKNEITQKGIYYSELWNVVDSVEWANLKPETGEGGTFVHRQDSIEKIRDYQKNVKEWSQLAEQTRLNNCLKAASDRKGNKWSEEMRKARLDTYLNKNLDIATKIIELADSGLNNLTIAKTLNVSWEKVKYSLLHRDDFLAYAKIKEMM